MARGRRRLPETDAMSNVETWMTPEVGPSSSHTTMPFFSPRASRTPATRRSLSCTVAPHVTLPSSILASRSDRPLGSGSSTPADQRALSCERPGRLDVAVRDPERDTTFALRPSASERDDRHRERVVRLVDRAHCETPRARDPVADLGRERKHRFEPGRRRRPPTGAPGVCRTEDEGGVARDDAAARGSSRFRAWTTSAGALERARASGERLGRGFLQATKVSAPRAAAVQSTKWARRIGRSFVPAHGARCKVFSAGTYSRGGMHGYIRRNTLGKRPSCSLVPRESPLPGWAGEPLSGLDVATYWLRFSPRESRASRSSPIPDRQATQRRGRAVQGSTRQVARPERAGHLRPGRAVRGRRSGRSDEPARLEGVEPDAGRGR